MSGARVRPIKHLLNLITGWFHKGWHLISITVHHGLHVLHRTYTVIATRHLRRWAADTTYRRALLSAVMALGTVLWPHPMIAAALAGAASQWQPRRYDDEYEDEPYERRNLWDSSFR